MIDCIVVGQGIAGTVLSYKLLQKGYSIVVVDEHSPSSASMVSSGMMNPITGRNFTKTWMADELFPEALNTYRGLEQLLQIELLRQLPIYKLMYTNEAVNDWSVRCDTTEYQPYLQNKTAVQLSGQWVNNPFGSFEISGAMQADAPALISGFRNFLQQRQLLRSEVFDYAQLNISNTQVTYKDVSARRIVFAQGHAAATNPYFQHLPLAPTKGECLIVDIPGFYTHCVVNGDVFIMPTTSGKFYIGSTYFRTFTNSLPSQQGLEEMSTRLQKMLVAPYSLHSHLAAIRPNTNNRKPIVGTSVQHHNVHILNGMGTKGFSLAPYWSNVLIQHMENNTALPKLVDANRLIL